MYSQLISSPEERKLYEDDCRGRRRVRKMMPNVERMSKQGKLAGGNRYTYDQTEGSLRKVVGSD